MADICDMAQGAEEMFRLASLAQAGSDPAGPSLTHCEECGEPIPEARRTAAPGCRLCTECQEEADRG